MDPTWLQLLVGAVSPGLNFLGTGTLVYLFGSNRILTRGQHRDRIEDLKADYAAQLAEKDRHHTQELATLGTQLADAKDAVKIAHQTAAEERARADAATNQLAALSQQVARVVATTLDPKALTP